MILFSFKSYNLELTVVFTFQTLTNDKGTIIKIKTFLFQYFFSKISKLARNFNSNFKRI